MILRTNTSSFPRAGYYASSAEPEPVLYGQSAPCNERSYGTFCGLTSLHDHVFVPNGWIYHDYANAKDDYVEYVSVAQSATEKGRPLSTLSTLSASGTQSRTQACRTIAQSRQSTKPRARSHTRLLAQCLIIVRPPSILISGRDACLVLALGKPWTSPRSTNSSPEASVAPPRSSLATPWTQSKLARRSHPVQCLPQ